MPLGNSNYDSHWTVIGLANLFAVGVLGSPYCSHTQVHTLSFANRDPKVIEGLRTGVASCHMFRLGLARGAFLLISAAFLFQDLGTA